MIGNFKHMADLQALARDELLCRPMPSDLAGEIGQIVHENVELRQRLVLCQIEYEKTQELARENYRRYADKCKEDSRFTFRLEAADKRIADLCSCADTMQKQLLIKDAQIAKLEAQIAKRKARKKSKK